MTTASSRGSGSAFAQYRLAVALCRLLHTCAEALDDDTAMETVVRSCRAVADALEARAVLGTERRMSGPHGALVAAAVQEFVEVILRGGGPRS